MRIIIFVTVFCLTLSQTAVACICPGYNFPPNDPNYQAKAETVFEGLIANSEFVGLARLLEVRPRDPEVVKKEIEYYKARNEFPIPMGRDVAVLEPLQSYKSGAVEKTLFAGMGGGCSNYLAEVGKIYEIIVFRNKPDFGLSNLGDKCTDAEIGKNWITLRAHAKKTAAYLKLQTECRKKIGKTWAIRDHIASCYSDDNKDK